MNDLPKICTLNAPIVGEEAAVDAHWRAGAGGENEDVGKDDLVAPYPSVEAVLGFGETRRQIHSV
jgi:hypothetical protein